MVRKVVYTRTAPMEVVGIMSQTNTSTLIVYNSCDMDENVWVGFALLDKGYTRPVRYKVYSSEKMGFYFKISGSRFYFKDIMRNS